MKKVIIVLGLLIVAVLMLPGILQPPAQPAKPSAAARGTEAMMRKFTAALDAALLEYRRETGRFPEGGAGEIISALRGRDETEKHYINLAPEAVNEQGEMLDPWGTPLRIAFEPGSEVPRIHSAGPNRHFEDLSSKSSDDYYSWQKKAAPVFPLFQ